jgi:hypothetical protein
VPSTVSCFVCETRKPRRACPALHAEICTVCCATGREESIDCPLECEYLRDAHRHERQAFDASQLPNQDIEVTSEFLEAHEILVAFTATAVFEGVKEAAGATDWDIREALQSLIKNNGAEPGANAAVIAGRVQTAIADLRSREEEAAGVTTIDDRKLQIVLAFLQRLEYSHNNGRKHCRAFIDFLSSFYNPSDMGLAVS